MTGAEDGGARAEVSLPAVQHNVALLSALVRPAATLLAVKSDAYGHGLLEVSRTGLAAGASWLGVLEIDAGLRLRREGIRAPLFAWMHGADADFRAAIEQRIDLGVSAPWQLAAIARAAEHTEGGRARVHLKIDTGLHRSGANPEDWPALVSKALELQRAGRLEVVAAWSHLSDTSPAVDREAVRSFRAAVDAAAALGAEFELLHLAASSAGIDLPEARYDLVRFGIAAYGVSPFHDRSGRELGLVPALRLTAPVIESSAGRATIAIGYGDGLQSLAGAQRWAFTGGRRVPILTTGPDRSVLDTGGSRLAGGERVMLFGPGDDGEPTAEEWAAWCDTVPDEILTGLTARVPRIHLA